jgi:xylulokinase
MLSAAGSLAWARDTIAPGVPFDALIGEAAAAPPGCDGLVFLPYLAGERCPHADPRARGAWVGLTLRHTRGHLIRAVIEGVTFGMGQILDLVRGTGVGVSSVRVSGGGNRSALWRQVQADVYGCPVQTTASEEGGSALGAAILAGVGIGWWPSVASACRRAVRVTGTTRPSRDARKYLTPRENYGALYDELAERFRAQAR